MSIRLLRQLSLGVVACLPMVGPAFAQESQEVAKTTETQSAIDANNATLAKLDPELFKAAIQTDTLTIPTPGELFEALNNEGLANWSSQYRAPIPTTYSNRIQIALNLGGLIADGYIAVEAQDSQQVKNIGKDISSLAKSLGVSDQVIARGNSITEFAENNEWIALKEELEATQNEVKLAMEGQHDEELVNLVSLGGWIRGTQVVSGLIAKDYNPEMAKTLRQPALVAYIRAKIAALPEKEQADPLIKLISDKLGEIQAIVSFPADKAPTAEEVKKLNDQVSELIQAIIKK